MAHRKILTVTVKVVVDINTSAIEKPINSEAYNKEINDLIDEFFFDTDCSFSSNEAGDVNSVGIISYESIL